MIMVGQVHIDCDAVRALGIESECCARCHDEHWHGYGENGEELHFHQSAIVPYTNGSAWPVVMACCRVHAALDAFFETHSLDVRDGKVVSIEKSGPAMHEWIYSPTNDGQNWWCEVCGARTNDQRRPPGPCSKST